MNKDELMKLYNQLTSMNTSLAAQAGKSTISDGTWDIFNKKMSILANALNDDHFLELQVRPKTDHRGGYFMIPSDLIAKVYSATSYLFEQYTKDYTTNYPHPPSGKKDDQASQVSVNQVQNSKQDQTQTMEVNIEFNQTFKYIIEKITNATTLYQDGTPEKSFINKLKNIISTAKSTAEIIKLIVVTGAEFGLTAAMLSAILN